MQIKLMIGEEEKSFVAHFVKGRILRRAFELNKKFETMDQLEQLDSLVAFVCEVFGDQFTPDQVWDGLPLETIFPEVQGIFNEVVEKATSGVKGGAEGKNAQ